MTARTRSSSTRRTSPARWIWSSAPGKPLQELSWASIGNVLTAIQIREARSRGVLVQWHAWRPERFKTAATLHDADRGGTTLSPV
ncbi:hypothetical protein, partial [Halapricum sp. CBA1109]|uniref:hypothetical protein n=1 Tax=Halapricum sp. CBA1109 TaxID=2668068 RepID=UPI001E5F16F3